MYADLYELQIYNDERCIIIFSGKDKAFYAPLGDKEYALDLMMSYATEKSMPLVITKITEADKEFYEGRGMLCEADRDAFDYIFRNSDLRDFNGSCYRKQRNNISKYLLTMQPSYTTDISEHLEACRHFTEEHYAGTDVVAPTLRVLDNFAEFDFSGGVVWSNGVLQAFNIYEQVSEDMVLSHVELTDNNYRGVHAYMINHMAKNMHLPFINKEDDMGLEGLRRFKERYHPAILQVKYKATLR